MKRQVRDLKPHPLNAEIYGDGCDEKLLGLIRKYGFKDDLDEISVER